MSENLEKTTFLDVGTATQIFAFLGMFGLIGVWIVEALAVSNPTWIIIGLMAPSVIFFFGVSVFFAVQSHRSKRTVREDI